MILLDQMRGASLIASPITPGQCLSAPGGLEGGSFGGNKFGGEKFWREKVLEGISLEGISLADYFGD